MSRVPQAPSMDTHQRHLLTELLHHELCTAHATKLAAGTGATTSTSHSTPDPRREDPMSTTAADPDDTKNAELIAAALVKAGFDPPPYVGEKWIDRGVTWLPDGHLSIVTITALGNTVTGWQARVHRRQIDATGATVEDGGGDGIIYVRHLFGQIRSVFNYERIPA